MREESRGMWGEGKNGGRGKREGGWSPV